MFTSFWLFGTALLLGLRHGIDWDHIAAITDITTSSPNKKESLFLGAMYAVGHGLVIIVLGLSAVVLGARLPPWVDKAMQPFVGVTLILLGVYLAFSIIRHGKNVRLRSRWMLLFATAARVYDAIERKVTHKHTNHHFHYPDKFGPLTAFIVGIVHGIGAETPTQILLFIAASNAGGTWFGSLLVITFVIGLVISNTLISVFSIFGITKAKENANIYLFLAGVTAIFSLVVGSIFLFGKATTLPAIIYTH
jgi:high-affinity nickel-transport protein